MKWITLESKIDYECPHFSVRKDRIQIGHEEQIQYYYFNQPPSVMIIPVTSSNEILLVKQYRYVIQQDSWELPCGAIDEQETPQKAATRELEEETGFRAGSTDFLYRAFVSNGTSNALMHYFVATELDHVGQKLDQTEEGMEVRAFSLADCLALLSRGEITCASSALGVTLFAANSSGMLHSSIS